MLYVGTYKGKTAYLFFSGRNKLPIYLGLGLLSKRCWHGDLDSS